jgi:arginyl-tRNA synthetase
VCSSDLGALKYFLLRVDPKKKMIFNPEESIDFHGSTGPFIQYTHARIKSILRKASVGQSLTNYGILEKQEKDLLLVAETYDQVIKQAADALDPSTLANYLFQLAQNFNSFYAAFSIVNAETIEKRELRLRLASIVATILDSGMKMLGIQVPEKM